ncbi:MAG: GAF domain-containing protein [Anaerolineales bacterium]|nr:GAF domain-containing protein [Anaerolineales bacterium]
MNTSDPFQILSKRSSDSKFRQPINLLDLIFERLPMGVAILDRDYRIRRYNPTWGDFAVRYAPLTGKPLVPGVGYFEHLPGAEAIVLPMFERVLTGETVGANGVRLESGGIISYWDIFLAPLVENNEIIGILNVAADVTEKVSLQQNLEQRVEERTLELQMLLDVSAVANSSLNLDETLERTLDLIVALVGASRAGVVLLDEQTGELAPHVLRPLQNVAENDLAKMLSACRSVTDEGISMNIVPNPAQGLFEPGALLPLQIRERKLGVLVIVGSQGTSFSTAQLALFQSIADQLSVAIENARLFEKNEQAAVTAERNRLARDLHDAVTQTLFSSSMIADVLPKIWERNPEEGRRRLEELRQLTRGALSEMRTLLVELRPAALVDTDLGDLVGHQVNAFIARTRLSVEYKRSCTHNPPPEIKDAFYRIAQEALSNIAKHAEASQVNVDLNCDPKQVGLKIQDNGMGFDPLASDHEGLGLKIMQERARNVGAKLEIHSQLQAGATLRLDWQAPGNVTTQKEN